MKRANLIKTYTLHRSAQVLDYIDFSQTLDFDSIFGLKDLKDPVKDTIVEEDFTITDVYFDYDQYSIPDTSKPKLDKLTQCLN